MIDRLGFPGVEGYFWFRLIPRWLFEDERGHLYLISSNGMCNLDLNSAAFWLIESTNKKAKKIF